MRSSLSHYFRTHLTAKSESESGGSWRTVLPRTSTTTLQNPTLSTTRTTNRLFNTSSFFFTHLFQDQTIFLPVSKIFKCSCPPYKPDAFYELSLIPPGNLRCYTHKTKSRSCESTTIPNNHWTKETIDEKNLAHHSCDYEGGWWTGSRRLHIIERATDQFPSCNFLVTETRLQSLHKLDPILCSFLCNNLYSPRYKNISLLACYDYPGKLGKNTWGIDTCIDTILY